MEARELRINNIVMLDETKPVRILWFKLEVACIMEVGKDYPSAIVRLERLSGLPLNEEWLVKFVFIETTDDEDENKSYEIKSGRKSFRLVKLDDINSWMVLYQVDIGMRFKELTDVEFVHHFQTLFYALTNEELALNHETN